MQIANPFDQKLGYKFANKIKGIRALHDHVLITDMDFSGRKLSSGIILPGDDGTTAGIRPRWGRVYAVGPDQQDVQVGQWVLVEHGRWTRGLKIQFEDTEEEITIRRADPNGIIFVSDEEPDADDTISSAVQSSKKER
jgi:Chaperonin 10 Kd subunit